MIIKTHRAPGENAVPQHHRHIADVVTVNDEGFGEFRCQGGSVSVWVQE